MTGGNGATPAHDPQHAAAELSAKLAARSRHVCFLTGAGTSRAAGLPDLVGLQAAVLERVPSDLKPRVEELLAAYNLEETLSRLRRIASLVQTSGSVDGLDHTEAVAVDAAMCAAIITSIVEAKADLTAFVDLASWAAGDYYRSPIELFTVNYDPLLERGLETVGVPYFDGFVGALRAPFHPELVEALPAASDEALPAAFVRLWKLHGSITWAIEETGRTRGVVRLGCPATDDEVAAIYPSDEKYDASRRVPFVVLMDRFRRSLLEPETLAIISGYSFGDQHLNEIIFDAARRRPRSETVVCCYGELAPPAAEVAAQVRNVTVLGAHDAIIGGVRAAWAPPDGDILDVWGADRFLLGDFTHLAHFLGGARDKGDGEGGA